jgi:phosphatidylglycerol:prolipoprotein diacylglycerol transferase
VIVHSAFDLLAIAVAAAIFWLMPMPETGAVQPWRVHPKYVSLASLGMMLGALAAGTGNLLLSGFNEIGKSVVGGLAGAIIAIELLKRRLGIRFSTGLRFAAPLAAAIAVGRLGCFLSGMEDRTYGTPTSVPWGHDFGDGILRHPVQLYEAIVMLLFLVMFVPLLRGGFTIATRAGFYLFVGIYAAQRFVWEFIKPYGAVMGPFNLFHLICIGLIGYAWTYGRAELRNG